MLILAASLCTSNLIRVFTRLYIGGVGSIHLLSHALSSRSNCTHGIPRIQSLWGDWGCLWNWPRDLSNASLIERENHLHSRPQYRSI